MPGAHFLKSCRRVGPISVALLALCCRSPRVGVDSVVQSTPLDIDLFNGDSIIQFTIKAPLRTAFDAAKAGRPVPDSQRVKEKFVGTWLYENAESNQISADFEVRGKASLMTCPFPKLKAKIHSPGKQQGRVKIGTHCDNKNDPETGPLGRAINEKIAYREALAYKILQILQLPSQKARPALATYVDTEDKDIGEGKSIITRQAFLLEDAKDLAARMGASEVWDEKHTWSASDFASVDKEAQARVMFAQALFGNEDWMFDLNPPEFTPPVWNVEAVVLPGKLIPIASDFDLSSFVSPEIAVTSNSNPADFYPTKSMLFKRAARILKRTNGKFPADLLIKAKEHFVAHKEEAENAAKSFPLDEDGRANILAHIHAFYEVLREVY
ncbi:MAG: hypothetical protein AB7T49_05135 [Oligoflexales bacterium]